MLSSVVSVFWDGQSIFLATNHFTIGCRPPESQDEPSRSTIRLNFDVYFDFVHVCEKEGTRDSNAARKLWQILKRISRLFVVHVLISTINNDK